jgi:uncharacterized membrane protein YhaH (DUF805 family)
VATTAAGFSGRARRHRFCFFKLPVHATFIQKVILCAIAGFLAASLIQWGKMFVTGADDALNKGYQHTAPGLTKSRP